MLTTRSIVAITDEHDAHLSFVQCHLAQGIMVVDPARLWQSIGLSYEMIAGDRRVVLNDDTSVRPKGVWYRKPKAILKESVPVSDEVRDYSWGAIQNYVSELRIQFPEALWVSDYYAIQRSEHKSLQLTLARQIGFRVPDTLITASAAKALDFQKKHGVIVVKTLSNFGIRSGTGFRWLPATRIRKGEKISLDGLHLAPAIFQQAVEAAADVRVTVVGSKVFAAIIYDTADKDHPRVRDWRYQYTAGRTRFERYHDLPNDMHVACIALVKRLGLQFGAIDLVMDKKGNPWFLEINPNGQWAFIEEDTGLPIGKAMAELLEKGRS